MDSRAQGTLVIQGGSGIFSNDIKNSTVAKIVPETNSIKVCYNNNIMLNN